MGGLTADTANPAGPVYITNGLGGHYDGMDVLDSPLPPNIEHGIDGVYGWSRLTFSNATHMKHEFIAARNSTVLDEFWVVRERETEACCAPIDNGNGDGGKGTGNGNGKGKGNGKGQGNGHGKGNGGKPAKERRFNLITRS